MVRLYAKMILLHQVVAPLIVIQKEAEEVLEILNVASGAINQLQEWDAKYPNVPPQLVRKERNSIEMGQVQFRFHHQNYNHLGEHVTNKISSYFHVHNGLQIQNKNMGCLQQDHLNK